MNIKKMHHKKATVMGAVSTRLRKVSCGSLYFLGMAVLSSASSSYADPAHENASTPPSATPTTTTIPSQSTEQRLAMLEQEIATLRAAGAGAPSVPEKKALTAEAETASTAAPSEPEKESEKPVIKSTPTSTPISSSTTVEPVVPTSSPASEQEGTTSTAVAVPTERLASPEKTPEKPATISTPTPSSTTVEPVTPVTEPTERVVIPESTPTKPATTAATSSMVVDAITPTPSSVAPEVVADNGAASKGQTERTSAQAARRILSEQEQDSYVVGMMVADYARSILHTLDKLDVKPNEALFHQGLEDTLAGKAVLDNSTAQAAMQRIQKEADQRQAERDTVSKQTLATLAAKNNTVEKKDDQVWVRLKKGGIAVSKKTPLVLSWEGQFYNGAIFETVTDAEVTRRDVLPTWLQRAIRLAGPGGQVRLYSLAGSLEGEAPLPAGTARHELVQYTISVKKSKLTQ